MPPVEEHPVHTLTKVGANHKPGCYNRGAFSKGHYAEDREYKADGTWSRKLVWIPHVMSIACRQIGNLPECEGCTAKKDLAYISKWKGAA